MHAQWERSIRLEELARSNSLAGVKHKLKRKKQRRISGLRRIWSRRLLIAHEEREGRIARHPLYRLSVSVLHSSEKHIFATRARVRVRISIGSRWLQLPNATGHIIGLASISYWPDNARRSCGMIHRGET